MFENAIFRGVYFCTSVALLAIVCLHTSDIATVLVCVEMM